VIKSLMTVKASQQCHFLSSIKFSHCAITIFIIQLIIAISDRKTQAWCDKVQKTPIDPHRY